MPCCGSVEPIRFPIDMTKQSDVMRVNIYQTNFSLQLKEVRQFIQILIFERKKSFGNCTSLQYWLIFTVMRLCRHYSNLVTVSCKVFNWNASINWFIQNRNKVPCCVFCDTEFVLHILKLHKIVCKVGIERYWSEINSRRIKFYNIL